MITPSLPKQQFYVPNTLEARKRQVWQKLKAGTLNPDAVKSVMADPANRPWFEKFEKEAK